MQNALERDDHNKSSPKEAQGDNANASRLHKVSQPEWPGMKFATIKT